jgi:hypothetical protein
LKSNSDDPGAIIGEYLIVPANEVKGMLAGDQLIRYAR